jgi:hypothetical protein
LGTKKMLAATMVRVEMGIGAEMLASRLGRGPSTWQDRVSGLAPKGLSG